MFCGDSTAHTTDGIALQAVPLRCRRWTCPDCVRLRSAQLRLLGLRGAPDTFITLTANPASAEGVVAAANALRDAWRVVRKRAMKFYHYRQMPFLAVFEETKAGWPHLHILVRTKWIGQKWLSEQMNALTDSPIVWITRLRSKKKAGAYVAKYCSKAPARYEGCKRYWRSMDWALPEDTDDTAEATDAKTWQWMPGSLDHWEDEWRAQGYKTWRADGALFATDVWRWFDGRAPPAVSGVLP